MVEGDPPDVYREERRKARKQHCCCECRRTIAVGESYTVYTMLFEGKWYTYKCCLWCYALRRNAEIKYRYFMRDADEAPALGELHEWLELAH